MIGLELDLKTKSYRKVRWIICTNYEREFLLCTFPVLPVFVSRPK